MVEGLIEARVRCVMSTVLDRPLDGVASDAQGSWDSVDWINILLSLEEAFAVELRYLDDWERIDTIAGISEVIARRTAC